MAASQQSTFEELVAINQHRKNDDPSGHVSTKVCNKKIQNQAETAIDDFLYNYLPELNHIQEFMSSPFDDKCSHQNDTHNVWPTCISQYERSSEQYVQAARPAIQDIRIASPSIQNVAFELGNYSKPNSTVSKKRKLSPEVRAERRREQNREAQRRYRERQMFPLQFTYTQVGERKWLQQ